MFLLVVFASAILLVGLAGRCGTGTAPEGPSAAGPTVNATAVANDLSPRPSATREASPPAIAVTSRMPAPTQLSGDIATTPSAEAEVLVPTSPLETSIPEDTPTAAEPRPTEQKPQQDEPRYYTVRAGDTLWSISRSLGLSVGDLVKANKLDPDANLTVGQRLRIPSISELTGLNLPSPQPELGPPAVGDLEEIAPGLTEYLKTRAGRSAAAIYLSGTDTLYVYNPDERFQLASVVKVPIMLSQLRAVYEEDRNAVLPGTDLLAPMITVSDNAAATALLAQVGGPTAVQAEMEARGLENTKISKEAWGLSTTTARDMALLMRSLYFGERLNAGLRGIAFRLLSGVVPEQRWGVPAGLRGARGVAFKGGWLPLDQGWLVHQVGVAEMNSQPVVFAFLNKGQPSFAYGKATLRYAALQLSTQGQSK